MKTEVFAPYKKLLERAREIALLGGAADLLAWDEETYMPANALGFRAEQMAYLGGKTHRLFTARSVGDWIKACEDHRFPTDSEETANIREWRRLYDRKTKLPAVIVEELQRVRSHARDAWVEARNRSDFTVFAPHLAKVIEINRQMADHWGYEDCPYDALLDEYEPAARSKDIQALFKELRPAITAIIQHQLQDQKEPAADVLSGRYPQAAQEAFNREVAEAIGFDFKAGRIDTTAHPFCTSPGPGDCRLTTRYNERDFTQSLYGILHEAGHGMYDQGLPEAHHGTPLGAYVSLGIHESQSRLWENHVGRSESFWEFWHPRACAHFPNLKKMSPDRITKAVNRVKSSFIRTEADQVTYDLHILLRFEIEMALFYGHLKIKDIPAFWNEGFLKMFGLKVKKDADGCLQDVHWSHGSFGYFPTYTLGNLNAAQLMEQARKECPALDKDLLQGRYETLLNWLRKSIHQHGRRYHSQELMRRVTGKPTMTACHLDYLKKKNGL